MRAVREALALEVEAQERRLERLRAVQSMLDELDGVEPAPGVVAKEAMEQTKAARRAAQARKAGRASAAGRDGLGPSQQRVLELVREQGPMSPKEVAERLGMTRESVKAAAAPLIRRGLIVAEGNTIYRMWRAPAPADDPGSPRARTQGGQEKAAASLTSRVNRVQLRARVQAAVLAEPGVLTERMLADRLGESSEEIADACGKLLLDDVLALNPDGTYVRGPRAVVA